MSSFLEASQWNRNLLVPVIILLSDYSKVCLGLKLLAGDNGDTSRVGGWSISGNEDFMSLVLTGMGLLRFVRNRSYFSSLFLTYLIKIMPSLPNEKIYFKMFNITW